eukprot:2401864-Prymnesium_polylepis.1
MISLLASLAAGDAEPPNQIVVSKAVAIQIWHLVLGHTAVPELNSLGWNGVWRILTSLATGTRVL